MKKANFSLVLTAMVFFMFLGVQSFAQNASEIDNPLTNKVLSTNGVSLVSDVEAIDILSAEYKDVSANMNDYSATNFQEATTTAKLAYYKYLLSEIINGSGVKAALENSGQSLNEIVARYNPTIGVSTVTVYEDTVDLLEQ